MNTDFNLPYDLLLSSWSCINVKKDNKLDDTLITCKMFIKFLSNNDSYWLLISDLINCWYINNNSETILNQHEIYNSGISINFNSLLNLTQEAFISTTNEKFLTIEANGATITCEGTHSMISLNFNTNLKKHNKSTKLIEASFITPYWTILNSLPNHNELYVNAVKTIMPQESAAVVRRNAPAAIRSEAEIEAEKVKNRELESAQYEEEQRVLAEKAKRKKLNTGNFLKK